MRQEEHYFTCPSCWQEISMLLDTSAGSQTYVEDCEVCCRPLQIAYRVENAIIVEFSAELAG